ncbi:hypothetical protein S1OALGB6SA_2382 [Olavius algarvensis spirochete endosymbiont]|uniref:cell division protein ZapA n=1 Tax=Olavius algarvensis spirochete endosymbiont TaxID=260710 RepID=UPI00052BF0FC|nr:cell division protein ZapA [Olavius algarvensis spirochete endosymbiont]KGM43907.1 hypothetical protein JY97_04305 [Alkalispirochaeta odontotermitis]VDB01280.1 hypothetical protein S1OALGB6SA_2382 [Olavius algarvensis spirochete endosymbiont]
MPGGSRLNIEVLGTSFTVRTDEDEAYLKRILWYFKHKVEETKRNIHISDPMKISILTSFYIIDELLKEKSWGGRNTALPEESEEMERITLRLIAEMDEVIGKIG